MSKNEPGDLELNRRVLADLEELNAEFHVGMDQVPAQLHAAVDELRVKAMGMITSRLRRASCRTGSMRQHPA